MKKILMGTAVAALVLTVGLTTAFAAGGRYYVDANGDGSCDNQGSYCRFVDTAGAGSAPGPGRLWCSPSWLLPRGAAQRPPGSAHPWSSPPSVSLKCALARARVV